MGEHENTAPEGCPFCAIAAGAAPAIFVQRWPDTIAIVPRHPVVPGHTLVIPVRHVPDFAADPDVSATTMRRAAELMRLTPRPMNVITSRGAAATQTVPHLHLHLVPRAEGDGLCLPWTAQCADGRRHARAEMFAGIRRRLDEQLDAIAGHPPTAGATP